MAEGGFEYETLLKDGMSGPGKAEIDILQGLQKEIEKTTEALEKLTHEHKEHEHSLIPEIALGELAAEGLKKLAESAVDVAVEGAKFAFEMSEFREEAEKAYEVTLGTKDKAEEAFKGFEELGRAVHLPVDRAQKIASDLLLQGEQNVDTIKGVLTGIADLQRVGFESGAAKFQTIVERSLAQGAFVLPKKLQGLGVSLPEILDVLAKRLGESAAQVKIELKKGKINAEDGIEALSETIAHGRVGELARSKLTLGDVATDLRSDLISIFERVDISPIIHGFQTLTNLLEDADGSTKTWGDQVVVVFNELARWIDDTIVQLDTLGLNAESSFLEAEQGAQRLFDPTGVKGFEGSVHEVVTDVRELADAFKTVYDIVSFLPKQAVKGLGFLAFQGEDSRLNLEARLRAIDEEHKPLQGAQSTSGHELGKAFADGVIRGMNEKKGELQVATVDLVGIIEPAARTETETHSPSRKMYRVGEDIIDGIITAFNDKEDQVRETIHKVVHSEDKPVKDGWKEFWDDLVHGVPDVITNGGNFIDEGFFNGPGLPPSSKGDTNVHSGAVQVNFLIPTGTAIAPSDDLQSILEHSMYDAIERLVHELGG